MITIWRALNSSVGRKVLMALTGLALTFFVIVHLLGNLSLYKPDGTMFNTYAANLESLGGLLILAELGLIAMFGLHVLTALSLKKNHRGARPQGYRVVKTKGGPSKSTLSSRNMIITGLVLLVFLVLHIWQFKFGPNVAEGYVAHAANGAQVRDLHRLVVETFQKPLFVGVYVLSMLFVGCHLRHGFWSAFQSLGAVNPRTTNLVYITGGLIALLLAVGFLGIPLWIFFKTPGVMS